MGKKRKHEKSEEEIRRKIEKLQNKLSRSSNESNFSEETYNHLPLDTPYLGLPDCESVIENTQVQEPEQYFKSPLPFPASPCSSHPGSPRPATFDEPQPSTSALPPQSDPLVNNTTEKDDLELDDDILQLLGDAPKAETPLGPPIHKDIAQRWQHILVKGLAKDVKENLLKEYVVPSNCEFLLAPALNPEVKAALPDVLVKRDSSLLHKQKQLGVALSALATVTEMVLANETSKQKILKPLSDACRIICDSHFAETRTRRGFVISSINTKLKDTLIESSRDNLLFGENVSEKLKVAKTIQQSGEALKNAQRPKAPRPNANSSNGNRNHLNFVPQHRKTDNKPNNNRRASFSQRQPPTSSSARRTNDRPLPGKTSAVHPRR